MAEKGKEIRPHGNPENYAPRRGRSPMPSSTVLLYEHLPAFSNEGNP
jgi:hypothetical protein